MSLADELLADLEEARDEEERGDGEGGSGLGEESGPELEDIQEEMETDFSGAESVTSIAKLRHSKGIPPVDNAVLTRNDDVGQGPTKVRIGIIAMLDQVRHRTAKVTGPVEADPEYRLIVDANNLTVEIDNELNIIHKFVRDKYSKRFPELESLVPNSLDYIRTVQELGNNLDKCKNNENLQQILTNATIMVVSVTASTTQGTMLAEDELIRLVEACDMALELNQSKHRIYEYVESRMSFIAPNLSIIVGASSAAKIMGN
ncbi:UNVERIFIED_CONTAM: hypothetical protein FKN15_034336 [Acipenser sinensis]